MSYKGFQWGKPVPKKVGLPQFRSLELWTLAETKRPRFRELPTTMFDIWRKKIQASVGKVKLAASESIFDFKKYFYSFLTLYRLQWKCVKYLSSI